MSTSSSTTTDDTLSSTLVTGRALVLLQLLTRLLTFTLNQTLVRIAPPEVFGTAAIQFDLLCSTILFLSREGVRNALLRSRQADTTAGDKDGVEKPTISQTAALSGLPLQLGIVVSVTVVSIYLVSIPSSTTSQPSFHLSLCLYIISSLMELSIEPLYLRAIRSNPPKIRVRVQAEGGMAIVKAIVTVLYLLSGSGGALLGFAIGQITGASWLVVRYLWEYGATSDLLWVFTPNGQSRYHAQTFSLAVANTRQSFIKHILTEADRIAVGRISPLGDQGGYAVAMNYGSLIARIIFQPIEETLLLHFSSTMNSPSTPALLTFIIHISTHLLLLLPTFIPPLFNPIIPLLLPRRYLTTTSAAQTLETYLKWYLSLLSLNGLLEAFHAASAGPEQVAKQARWMVAGSAVFVASLWGMKSGLEEWGVTTEQALIYASCLSMVVRIIYAYRHAVRFLAKQTPTTASISRKPPASHSEPASPPDSQPISFSLRNVLPKTPTLLAAGISGLLLRLLERTGRWEISWKGRVELVGLGGTLGLTVLLIMYRVEWEEFRALKQKLRVKVN